MAKNCGNCGVDTVNDYETCIYCMTKSGTPSRWTEGENYVPDSISLRAVQCIERRAKQNGVKVGKELDKIEVGRELYYRWKKDNNTISGYYLRLMALNGYDTYYILTGLRGKSDGKE